MRSKKLGRQLKKSLECEEIDEHLSAMQEWVTANAAAGPAELAALVQNFGPFLDAVDAAYEQYESNLTHAQRSLELSGQEVEERNKLLRFEVKKVSDLLNNMRQAVFSVGPDGSIVAPVSKFADAVFGRSLIGSNVYDAVYPELDQKGEDYANLKSAMIGVYGEGELQWDLMEDAFPRRALIYLPGSERNEDSLRVLKISVGPIWNDNQLLERIMFIVEDVTDVEKLERKMAEEKAKANRTMQIIQEMVALARPQLGDFLARTTDALHKTRGYLGADLPDFDLVFRELHTVKGNARGYKFGLISAAAHRVESLVAACRGPEGAKEWNEKRAEIMTELSVLQDQVAEYVSLAQRILGIDASRGGQGAGAATQADDGQAAHVARLVNRLKPVLERLRAQVKHPALGEVHDIIERATDVPVRSALEQLAMMAQDVAHELGKSVVTEIADPGQTAIAPKVLSVVQDALVHLVRNAVDHGIEHPNDREASGKPAEGHVRISCDSSKPGYVTFIIEDDGRGLDSSLIIRKAISMGVLDESSADRLTEAEAYELIFKPGFTTKQEVTEVSGRGVGLDAARAAIVKMGGRVEITAQKGRGARFAVTVTTPLSLAALPVTG